MLKRFEPGCTTLFDWFYLIKDEIFVDSDNPYEYSSSLMTLAVEDQRFLSLANSEQHELLKDELFETMKLRAFCENVTCPVCYIEFSSAEDDKRDVHIFRECQHVFCKGCISEVAVKSIDNGQLDKVRCPASKFGADGHQQCGTLITENDLRLMGVEDSRIEKMLKFSVGQAIDKMDDLGWCPVKDCGLPADIN